MLGEMRQHVAQVIVQKEEAANPGTERLCLRSTTATRTYMHATSSVHLAAAPCVLAAEFSHPQKSGKSAVVDHHQQVPSFSRESLAEDGMSHLLLPGRG